VICGAPAPIKNLNEVRVVWLTLLSVTLMLRPPVTGNADRQKGIVRKFSAPGNDPNYQRNEPRRRPGNHNLPAGERLQHYIALLG
jgi:hypothetical protein